MENKATHLKYVTEYFGIQNKTLADALNVDQSLVSRWMTGKRQLKASSEYMEPLADFILSLQLDARDIDWLKKNFERDGLFTDFTSMIDVKRGLIFWLADDGAELIRNLGQWGREGLAPTEKPARRIYDSDYSVKAGMLDIAMRLSGLLMAVEKGSTLDIYLSNENISAIVDDSIVSLLIEAIAERGIHVRLLLSITSNTHALSKIITAYMQPIVTASMQFSVVHGMMQSMVNQMILLLPDSCAVVLTELPESFAPAVALFIMEGNFLKDLRHSFDRSLCYAQSIVVSYNDNFSRNILEIFYLEFAEPGDLDIIKDSINPMYM